jgi:hypothetical protein
MTSTKAREYLRSHLLGLVAIFIALTGTAVAANGETQSGTSDGPKASASVVTDTKFKKLKKRVAALEGTTSLPPSGPAGGSLTGTYPNPQLGSNVVGANAFGTTTERTLALNDSDAANDGAITATTASPDCLPGEQVLSGGWSRVSGTETDYNESLVVNNHADTTGQHSWIVTVQSDEGGLADYQAEALCLAP